MTNNTGRYRVSLDKIVLSGWGKFRPLLPSMVRVACPGRAQIGALTGQLG